MMFQKLAYAVEMAFDVPSAEKEVAKGASERFVEVNDLIDQASQHLDIMYNPFKKHQNIDTKILIEKAGVLNRYKQQVKKNFNNIVQVAWRCLEKFNYFINDTKIYELINVFKEEVEELEQKVNQLLNTLGEYESPNFCQDVLVDIEDVKNQCKELNTLIEERIIDYIDANILTKNWMTNTSNELNSKIENRAPVITQLFNERQKALEEAVEPGKMADIAMRNQVMTPAYTQRVLQPTDLRQEGEGIV